MSTTIRPARLDDLPPIRRLAVDNSMFTAEEFAPVEETFLEGVQPEHQDQVWLVLEVNREVAAAAYLAPEANSDRVWNLYFLAVDPQAHGRGLGTQLLADVERRLVDQGPEGARVLLIETSSTDQYARTRRFYQWQGYTQEATVREYYGPGDDKVIFWKEIAE